MQSKFAEMTKKFQKDLPKWFKMRKDNNSKGAQFLNAFGIQFDDIQFYLQYALDNQFIGSADVGQIDVIYKATIPTTLSPDFRYEVIGNGQRLQEMQDLKQFFEGIDTRFLERKEVYYPNPFYIDWERNFIYLKKSYGTITEAFPEGVISLRVYNLDDELAFEYDLPQMIHHVWNFFDEFGLLLDTPRLYAEKNWQYKERLLDVFRHPANSTQQGLENLLARELNLWKEITWKDGSVNLVIKDSNIIERSLELDGEPASVDYEKDSSGRIVFYGDSEYAGVTRKVRFISGIQMHTFHNKKDYAFQKELYSVDGVPTPMLQYYVDVITNQVPVMWDHFIWNESFWDIADAEMSGYGYLPNYNDSRFLNWTRYKG